jgi:hypothetical protein
MDLQESRDVNGEFKCFCVSQEKPICNDNPVCSDLLIIPGLAEERCAEACPQAVVIQALDDVQFVNDTAAANKNQTHFRVDCYCDDVKQCDTEYILFSDLSFLQACSSDSTNPNPLQINDDADCQQYCVDMTFDNGAYDPALRSCTCSNSAGSAVACDDSRANSQRPDSVGCFDQVGVSSVECPPTQAPTMESAGVTKSKCLLEAIMAMLVGMAAIVIA